MKFLRALLLNRSEATPKRFLVFAIFTLILNTISCGGAVHFASITPKDEQKITPPVETQTDSFSYDELPQAISVHLVLSPSNLSNPILKRMISKNALQELLRPIFYRMPENPSFRVTLEVEGSTSFAPLIEERSKSKEFEILITSKGFPHFKDFDHKITEFSKKLETLNLDHYSSSDETVFDLAAQNEKRVFDLDEANFKYAWHHTLYFRATDLSVSPQKSTYNNALSAYVMTESEGVSLKRRTFSLFSYVKSEAVPESNTDCWINERDPLKIFNETIQNLSFNQASLCPAAVGAMGTLINIQNEYSALAKTLVRQSQELRTSREAKPETLTLKLDGIELKRHQFLYDKKSGRIELLSIEPSPRSYSEIEAKYEVAIK
jgi:hypothetical protein